MQSNYLVHHGIKGMHWGVRRYQNYDGTLIGSVRSDRANRARSEANTAKKIATSYTDAMDKKAAKRQSQANNAKRFKSYKQSKADRAKEEAITAKKMANAYTNAMDKKADKREAQARKAEVKAKNKSNKNLTDGRKKALFAGSVVVGAAAGYGLSKVLNSRTRINSGRNAVDAVLKMSNGNYLLYPGLYPGR